MYGKIDLNGICFRKREINVEIRFTCINERSKMLLAASEEAVSYGATTFMIYTGAPQNTRRKN